jgi:DNA polymerase-3 subunit gamma/tau
VRDRYKIFIIDEAHMVTSAGFNALLKIVEEPPEHIKFIFATTEPDKVIGTIRSRTHHYPFRLVPPEPLMAYLEQLCRQENVPVAPGVLSLVIRAGAGSVRDSLSVLDQLMAGAGPNGLDYELAVALLGYTHASLLDDVVEAIAASDAATVFRAVDRVIQTGHDPRRFVEDLLERFRDLIIVQAMPESAQAILRGMPADQIARMQSQAHNLGAAELSRAADVTNTALTEMTGATSPRLHLELLCARILLPSSEQTERGIAARIDRVERRLNYAGADAGAPADAAVGAASVAPAAAAPTPAPAASAPVAAPAASAPAPDALPPAQSAPQVGPPTIHAAPATQDAPGREAPAAQAAPGREALAAPRITTGDWPMDDAAARDRRTAPDSHGGRAPESAARRPAASHPAASAPRPEQAQHQQPQHQEAPFQQAPRPEPAATQTAPSAPAPSSHAQPSSGTASAGTPSAGASAAGSHADVEVLRRAWPEVLQTLAKIKRSTWALVEPNAQVGQFDGQVLTLVFSTSGLAGAFGRADHSENLRQAIHKTIGIDCQITAVAGAGSSASSEPNPKAPTSRDIPAATTDADWGLAPTSDGPAQPEPAPARPAAAAGPESPAGPVPVSAGSLPVSPVPGPASPDSSAAPGAGDASLLSTASAVSAPQWSGPNITASPSSTATPAGAGRAAGGASTSGPSPSAAQETAQDLRQQAGGYSYPDDDWGPPLDEDAPPLDEEPPMDWEPSRQWQGSPTSSAAPETAPSAPQIRTEASFPAQADRQPAPETPADPWSRAVEQTPGVWALSSESNVGKYQEAADDHGDEESTGSTAPVYAPATAQPPNSGPMVGATVESATVESTPVESAPDTAGQSAPEFEPAYAMASSPAPGSHEYGVPTPAQGVRAPAVTAATDTTPVRVPVFASGPGPAIQSGPTIQAGPAVQAGPTVAVARTVTPEPATEAPARGKLSLYQRLSTSPEAEAGRAKVPARSAEEPAPYVQDIPSADDETIEESGVFGRAAVERILGGKLVEERSLDGSPLMPRY